MGISAATLAAYASIASAAVSIGGMLMKDGDKGGAAPGSPLADDDSAQDSARQNAVARRRAIAAKSPRSLLATMGGDDLAAAAPIGTVAAIGGKQTLGGA